jgi:hypothetical protein
LILSVARELQLDGCWSATRFHRHQLHAQSLIAFETSEFATKSNGIGLGLSICRSMVESHGGLSVFPAYPHGSVFQVMVPIGEADAERPTWFENWKTNDRQTENKPPTDRDEKALLYLLAHIRGVTVDDNLIAVAMQLKNGLDMEIWDHKGFVIQLTASVPPGSKWGG